MTAHLKVPVNERDHSIGPADAPVTLVEYGDYECPYCARAHPIVTAVRRHLGNTVRFVYRNFPLTEIHPHSLHAAEAAESVADHNGNAAFWRMHDTLFEHAQDNEWALEDENLVRYAAASGADPEQVRIDLETEAYAERVREDFLSGVRSGVNGTPTFFINGERFDGNWADPRAFAAALELAAQGPAHTLR
jgi:protein-disulfide isomerase